MGEVTATKNKLKPLKIAVKWLLLLLVLYFVYRTMSRHLADMRGRTFTFHWYFAVLSALALAGMACMRAITMRLLLAAYHRPLPWRLIAGIAWVPQLGKYVPGKFASVAGAMWMLRQHGVPGSAGFTTITLVGGFAMMTSFMLSTPLLVWHPGLRERFPGGIFIAAGAVLTFVFCMHPIVFGTVMNAILRRLKRQPLEILPRVTQYVGPLLTTFGQWICAGLGLWCAAATVTEAHVQQIPLFVATSALGMTLGYLALFAPGGLGVREAVYLVVLGSVVGSEITIAAIVVRIVHTIIDLVMAAVGAWLMRMGLESGTIDTSTLPPAGMVAE